MYQYSEKNNNENSFFIAFIVDVPGRQKGWMIRHGHILKPESDGIMICPERGFRYKEASPGILKCQDLDQEKPLPEALSKGKKNIEISSLREINQPPDG